jgi:hypothetical protein
MMTTSSWLLPFATHNKITRSWGLSFVVGFSMIYPEANCWFRSGLFSAVASATHGRLVVIAAAALRGLGNSPRLWSSAA